MRKSGFLSFFVHDFPKLFRKISNFSKQFRIAYSGFLRNIYPYPKPEDRNSTTQCFEMVGDLCVPCCPIIKENLEDFKFIEPPELNALEWIFTPKPRILGKPGSSQKFLKSISFKSKLENHLPTIFPQMDPTVFYCYKVHVSKFWAHKTKINKLF